MPRRHVRLTGKDIILNLTNWMSRVESRVTNTLGGFAARLTEMEQSLSAFIARMCKIETGVTSASSVSGCPFGSWPLLGPTDQPERIHCKTRTASARVVFDTRAKCQDLCGAISRLMAFHSRSTVPFATPRARFFFVNAGHQNTERSVDVFRQCGKLKEIFTEQDTDFHT